MKIKSFTLFENANQTNGNTYGMGNIGAPQPKKPNEEESKRIPHPEPEKPKEEEQPKNECIKSFSNFQLNEDGGVAFASDGNTSGMGNVSTPPVSTDGSINTYSGTGYPTETVGRGSGDIAAKASTFVKGQYKKRKKRNIKKEHFGTEQPKEKMYVTSYTDWLTSDGVDKNFINEIKNMSEDEIDSIINENKLTIEKMANELIMQRSSIDNIKENIKTLNKNISFVNDKLDNIIKLNNLKTK
ncbi:MAG: hypothetical protein HPY57_14135 [Ignavibacteria bacterium]|nr:hypothetical protein [Ignavibacteria bacterium]